MAQTEKLNRSIRLWVTLDLHAVKHQLLLIEDLYGSCGSCRHIGLNYTRDRKCPACHTEFKYLATRLKDPGEIAKIIARIRSENLPFQLIDRDDFEKAMAHQTAGDLFKS